MNALDLTQLVALAAVLGFASGIRLYAVLLVVGLVGFAGWVELPAGLQLLSHPFALAASGFMFAVEFFADKIPLFDSMWDAIHGFIRIPAGAALAATVIGGAGFEASALWTTVAAILGGSLAASSHLAKAGTRAMVNTSPEPFSNIATSSAEDIAVGGLLWLAFAYPLAALGVVLALLLLALWLLPRLWRFVRRAFTVVFKPDPTLRPTGQS